MRTKRSQRFIALIGDMVHSRELQPAVRASAQTQFSRLINELNRTFKQDIASKFAVTIGDEFQGLLLTAEVIPELIWTVEKRYQAREIRFGIGFGILHTKLQAAALNIDGPVLHAARAAITAARQEKLLGGVFSGFGVHDEILTGFAQSLHHMRTNWTDRQKEVVDLLRRGFTQGEAAARLAITRQAVSERAVSAGWDTYRRVEAAWRQGLKVATLNG
ncbi:MAG: SatD family protein [Cyanobacteria bacterium]|nr:SatD family protein [Cyanobacteriota bacterium]